MIEKMAFVGLIACAFLSHGARLYAVTCNTDNWSGVTAPFSWTRTAAVGNWTMTTSPGASITASTPLGTNAVSKTAAGSYTIQYNTATSGNDLTFTVDTDATPANAAGTVTLYFNAVDFVLTHAGYRVIYSRDPATQCKVDVQKSDPTLGPPLGYRSLGSGTLAANALDNTHTLKVIEHISGGTTTIAAYVDANRIAAPSDASPLTFTVTGLQQITPSGIPAWNVGTIQVCN